MPFSNPTCTTDKMKKVKKERKKGKKIDNLPLRFEPQIFEQNFPSQDLNFEEDWINKAHSS